MKIAIISDTHDNLINLGQCLSWCQENKIPALIHCGDLTNSETLDFLYLKFSGQLYLVKGNMEIYDENKLDKYQRLHYYGKFGQVELGGKTIGICHEPYLIGNVIEQGGCDIIFYGHTHEPWQGERAGVPTVNPGTLSGMFSKASFAVWDSLSGELELKLLELL
jgi:uncharacterized protein